MEHLHEERQLKVTIGEDGIQTVFPACFVSRRLCRLLNKQSLTLADLERIQALGYKIIVLHNNE